jgi:hypothetical protein
MKMATNEVFQVNRKNRMNPGALVILTKNLISLHPAMTKAGPAILAKMIIAQDKPKRPALDHPRMNVALFPRLWLLTRMIPFTKTNRTGHLSMERMHRMIPVP